MDGGQGHARDQEPDVIGVVENQTKRLLPMTARKPGPKLPRANVARLVGPVELTSPSDDQDAEGRGYGQQEHEPADGPSAVSGHRDGTPLSHRERETPTPDRRSTRKCLSRTL
jgi:hypothetical protein